jgi:hypothetical protein
MPKQNTVRRSADRRFVRKRKSAGRGRANKRGKGASGARKKSATPPEPSRNSLAGKLHRDPLQPPGPRIPIGEALRVHGLDEHAIAENFANVVGKLKHKTDQSGSVEKLLVDVLKDCARHLDASAPAPRSASGDVPVFVQLVHTVSRPARVLSPPPKAEDVAPPAS